MNSPLDSCVICNQAIQQKQGLSRLDSDTNLPLKCKSLYSHANQFGGGGTGKGPGNEVETRRRGWGGSAREPGARGNRNNRSVVTCFVHGQVTLSKDGASGGDFALEAGALVLGDQGEVGGQ